jgi:hypothetical protein
MLRQRLLGASLAVMAVGLFVPGVSSAATHPNVGPHQAFAGSVNGSSGRPTPAVIRVVCPGPEGNRGHPVSGQTVEVGPAASTASTMGYTGNDATSIGAFFGPPPPAASGPGQVSFRNYGVPKAIPTSLSLPCQGKGVVTFIPFPESPPTSRSASTPVEYVNVAVTTSAG